MDDLERYDLMQQIPKRTQKKIKNAKGLLDDAFSFYSFTVELNQINKNEIMNKVYNRLLEKSMIEEALAKDILTKEVESSRKMVKQFKKTEEESGRIIYELGVKYQMAKDECKLLSMNFEKRLNTLIRDFVNVYKKLAAEF